MVNLSWNNVGMIISYDKYIFSNVKYLDLHEYEVRFDC